MKGNALSLKLENYKLGILFAILRNIIKTREVEVSYLQTLIALPMSIDLFKNLVYWDSLVTCTLDYI